MMGGGAYLIDQERGRQIHEKGYSAEHDDKHVNGELALAAACYAVYGVKDGDAYFEVAKLFTGKREGCYEEGWPWDPEWDKREDHPRIKRLVIAGALIAAEIDRLLRAGVTE